jgi:hypothetical protein
MSRDFVTGGRACHCDASAPSRQRALVALIELEKLAFSNHLSLTLSRAREATRSALPGGVFLDEVSNLKATNISRPLPKFVSKSLYSKERLRVGNWIMQRLYDYAVKKLVELRLLGPFQHIVDPTPVRAVADKNLAVTPLDLCPTVAD